MGCTSSSMAVMKATKLPTLEPPLPACHKATAMTALSAKAAIICVSGDSVALATTDFSSSRRSACALSMNRADCARSAPCRRTMRQASTFSSTT